MKAKIKVFSMVLLLFSVLFGQSVNISGSFTLKERLNTKDSLTLSWNEAKLLVDMEAVPSENIRFFGEVRFSDFGLSDNLSLDDLSKRKGILLDVREAYLDVYDFLMSNLDLRAGKQIIVWGTADKINPTSNLSPYNYEDILDFGKKEGITAIKLTYSGDNFAVEGDFVPRFRPAILPEGDYLNTFMQNGTFQSRRVNIVNSNTFLIMPKSDIKESSEVGIRLSTTVWKFDLSLSYFNGLLGLPFAKSVHLVPLDTLGNMNLNTTLSFSRSHVIGTDFSTSLFGIGFWGEGALYIPHEFVMELSYPTYTGMVREYDTILKDPFFKYVLGADYHFKHNYYLNVQYVHGFLHEYGDSLKNYLTGRLQKSFLNDRLKITPLSGIFTFKKNIKDSFAFGYMPEIEYKPYDGVSILLGAFISDYKNLILFPGIDRKRQVYMKMKIEF